MEIHWIAVLLALAWLPKSSFTISNSNYNNQNQQQGSDWTIDKAKLIYHFSSTEQYNPSLRQAKSIFPIEQSTSNRHQDDNTQNRYHQQQQQYRNYNNNHNNNLQPPLPQPTSTFVASRLRQYPPVANQFSSHWRNLSPPAGPQQPPQSYPPALNQLKITRPSLPDMLPAIIQSQNTAGVSLTTKFQSPTFQYHGNSDITNKNHIALNNVSFTPVIDARIVSKPSLDVPTPKPNENSQVPLISPPKFSPIIPIPQNLIGYGNSPSESVVATKKPQPFPVYGPPKPLDATNINSQLIQPPVPDTNTEGPIVNPQVSATLNPDREIRFLIHKPGDEDVIKNVISEESKNTNEQVSFINGPTLHLQRKQKIYLPPKKKTIVYVLLKEPQIETDVEVMEQEVDPKPEVYIIYQKGKDMLTRHYSADDNTLKSVKDIPIPPSETEKLLLHGAASRRRETAVKAPPAVAATTPNPTATMCLNTPVVTSSSSSSSSSSKNNIKITTKDSTVKPTTKP